MKNSRTLIFDQLSKLRNEQSSGLTLVELMIVIAILATLAGIALPVYFHQIDKARITKAIAEIIMLDKLIMVYRVEQDSEAEAEVEEEEEEQGKGKGKKKDKEKGKEKIASPTDLPNSLDDIGYGDLQDPWGSPYQFANHADIKPGQRRKYKSTVPLNTDYDLYSMGPDGSTAAPITAKAGYDDIIRASDGEYVGPASQY